MKRSTLSKLALTLVAAFVFVGANAQTHPGTAVIGQANGVTYGNDGSVYMVEGTTIPVYAKPDPVYHSSWDYATKVWTLTDGFVWNWSVTAGTAANISFSQNAAQDNYVEITAAAISVGVYTINVKEKAPAAYGGCEDATGKNLTLNVVATPAITLGPLAGTSPNYCEGDALIPTAVNTTISGGWQNYRLSWNLEIATLGAGLAKDYYYTDETGAGSSAVQIYAANYTETAPQAVAASGTHDIMTVGSFAVIDSKPTVYTYTVNSINDQALRFGDFIDLAGVASNAAAFTYNPVTGNGTYTIRINPKPVTGPIYHIPSTWAQ